MKSLTCLLAAAVAGSIGIGGCASAPTVRLHTLVSADGSVLPAAAAGAAVLPISLGVASVPAQIDQPQWLVRLPDDTLALLDQERWAAPLRDELRAALAQRLAAGYGAVDARSTQPRWRVRVDVTRFESLPDREARLDASWSVSPADMLPAASASAASSSASAPLPAVPCRSSLREPVGAGAPALAAGHRRAAVALADAIGRQLQALQKDAAAACPA